MAKAAALSQVSLADLWLLWTCDDLRFIDFADKVIAGVQAVYREQKG